MVTIVFVSILVVIALLTLRDLRYGIGFLLCILPLNGIITFAAEGDVSLALRVWYPILVAYLAAVVLLRSSMNTQYAIRINALDLGMAAIFGWGIVKLVLLQAGARTPLVWQLEGFRLYFYPTVFYFCVRVFILEGA